MADVARAVIDKLPDEEIIYLGDTDTPYGPRAIAQVPADPVRSSTSGLRAESRPWSLFPQHGHGRRARDARGALLIDAGILVIDYHACGAPSVIATRNHHVGVIGTKATIQRAYSACACRRSRSDREPKQAPC